MQHVMTPITSVSVKNMQNTSLKMDFLYNDPSFLNSFLTVSSNLNSHFSLAPHPLSNFLIGWAFFPFPPIQIHFYYLHKAENQRRSHTTLAPDCTHSIFARHAQSPLSVDKLFLVTFKQSDNAVGRAQSEATAW